MDWKRFSTPHGNLVTINRTRVATVLEGQNTTIIRVIGRTEDTPVTASFEEVEAWVHEAS